MEIEKLPFLLIGCVPTALFFLTLHSWWSDYQFYKRNNLDYSKDSGREMRYGAAYVRLGKMPNNEKMKYGYRRASIVFFLIAAIAFSPFYLPS